MSLDALAEYSTQDEFQRLSDEKVFDLAGHTRALEGVPLFLKGNVDHLMADRNGGWREEFPEMPTPVVQTNPQQPEMAI